MLIAKDVSEQVLAEEQLRVSEQRLRLLTDSARDVVWPMSPLGEVIYVSPAIEQLRGYTPQEAMRQTIDETLTPDSQAVSLQYFADVAAALQQGLPPPEFRSEREYWRKDGSRFWTEVLAFPVMGANGNLLAILDMMYEDSLRQTRERAGKANAAKTEFLAHISHEIRTPMSAILSLMDLTLATSLDDHQRALLSKSNSAGRLLLGISNDILDLSKLEDEVKQPEAQGLQTSDQVQGLCVLLAEDNPSMRGIVKQLLELAGAQVAVAENGQAAIQMLGDIHYDLVLMDIQMPVMGGWSPRVAFAKILPSGFTDRGLDGWGLQRGQRPLFCSRYERLFDEAH